MFDTFTEILRFISCTVVHSCNRSINTSTSRFISEHKLKEFLKSVDILPCAVIDLDVEQVDRTQSSVDFRTQRQLAHIPTTSLTHLSVFTGYECRKGSSSRMPCRHKAQIHYTSFPVASLQEVHNINNKSVTSWAGKSPLCLLCSVVSQIPLQRLVADLAVSR